ncbi:hypothetical protein M0R45_019151 [Rubus argutus]|uniref:CCT domain-containing protein n=1 Tax=Rubus argutus TaxID=59490 RepID=A0AAW1X526_RUBAR
MTKVRVGGLVCHCRSSESLGQKHSIALSPQLTTTYWKWEFKSRLEPPGADTKPCDTCKSSPAAVFCRADSSYLLSSLRLQDPLRQQTRVAPPARVDVRGLRASSCGPSRARPTPPLSVSTCDADIHSANPLARRHERVPVEPFLDSAEVSSSSLDVGVVPDGNSLSDISYPFVRNVSHNSIEPGVPVSATASQATQLCGVDREARVMRYREKRKNRKFQKTIRYASRKAYAETRPRIKGRFAKRTETETDVMDRFYSSATGTYMTDAQYGVVPTF